MIRLKLYDFVTDTLLPLDGVADSALPLPVDLIVIKMIVTDGQLYQHV